LLDLLVEIIQDGIILLVSKVIVDKPQQLLLPAPVNLHHIPQLLLKRSKRYADFIVFSGIPIDLELKDETSEQLVKVNNRAT